MKFCINTFGGFDIKGDGESVLKQTGRKYKLCKLFEFFLTFRNKKLLPETIIDNLLADSKSKDPKNVLRTQIFRLRKLIKSFLPEDADEPKYMVISFTNGYYFLKIGENLLLDVDEFEHLIEQADLRLEYDTETSVALYQKALKLYRGSYLSDNAYEVWLVPTRNYYRRLYLKTLYKLISILKDTGEREKIVSLCEEALLIEPYEENIHINLIEAMLQQGWRKAAVDHYKFSLDLLEKELDIKPQGFAEVLEKIRNYLPREEHVDIDSVSRKLKEMNPSGAMQCGMKSFKILFNMQKRKSLRDNLNDYLCIININKNKKNIQNEFAELLRRSLRKCDVFTFCNQNQVLVMFHNVKAGGAKVIKNRIYKNLTNYTKLNYSDVYMIFRALVSEK
mgnify:CR=1 FL=1|jgi:DNA-binding SARP family transcriptional activator